jgi:hypothetical protein
MLLRRPTLLALAAAAAVAGPAQAAPVMVVDGDRAQRVDDPFVPTAADIDLGAEPGRRAPSAVASGRGGAAVGRALRSRAITRADAAAYRRAYRGAVRTLRRLRGARRRELGYVVGSLERIAIARRLSPTRMRALFLQLRRNTSYWASRPFPAAGDQVTFRGSELLFQYFPGRGLQLHPLSNFKKANLLHGACGRGGTSTPVCGARPPGPRRGTPCRPERLRSLLDELSGLAVQRGRGFIAWEYLFDFGGGSPPWMSGMAQATGIVALGRASRLLDRPDYRATAGRALGAFEARAPVGIRARGPLGGPHYLQYSFARRLFIFNAFFQSLIGLHDYGRLAGDDRATGLFRQAEPEARGEVAHSDVGDWSRYSFRGRESTAEYHELLREVLQGLGRRIGEPYCSVATRYRAYQTEPPRVLIRGPAAANKGRPVAIRFSLSKLSVVEVKVTKGRRVALRTRARMRRGRRSVVWKPKATGPYTVRVAAKELRTGRSMRGSASARVSVQK